MFLSFFDDIKINIKFWRKVMILYKWYEVKIIAIDILDIFSLRVFMQSKVLFCYSILYQISRKSSRLLHYKGYLANLHFSLSYNMNIQSFFCITYSRSYLHHQMIKISCLNYVQQISTITTYFSSCITIYA